MKLDLDNLKFENCEDEPIHIPESIQSYGYLLALNSETYSIEVVSANVNDLFNQDIIGENFFNFVVDGDYDKSFILETYNRAKDQETRLPIQVELKEEFIRGSKTKFFAVVYKSNDNFVIEIEPAKDFHQSYSSRHFTKIYSTSIAPKFKVLKSLDEMGKEIVSTVKKLTGYQRVILYRFYDDYSGKVIAEEKDEGMDSYLGLMSPAGDIPEQARELYVKNWIRLTPDTELENVRLVPSLGKERDRPLDMTQSLLRSLSPIHLQYVRNQGIRSSMSMSLVTHNKLWGLIMCHNREKHYIPQNVRLECENLSQIFSWHLYAKEEELTLSRIKKIDEVISSLLEKVRPSESIIDVLLGQQKRILDLMNADGFIFRSKHNSISVGCVPNEETIKKMLKTSKKSESGSFTSSNLSETFGDRYSDLEVKGVHITPLTESFNHYTGWFRKEHVYTQKWAGNPDEQNPKASKKERLSPRTSFKVHEKTVHNQSKHWSENDKVMADRFHKLFLTHALEAQVKMKEDIINLEEQDQSKDEFLATLAHELRNPLSPILSGVELLELAKDDETKSVVIDTMKRQLSQMSSLVDDLMDVSRITQGKINLRPEPCFISEIVNQSLEIAQALISKKSHTVNVDIPDENLRVWADKTRLTQVFANIISNAAKYTNPNGNIEISISTKGQKVIAKIKDNGIGIPKDRLSSIFEMFSQVNPHSSRSEGGLGIGLMLVKRLVALHGGSISAESEGKGLGSTFSLSFNLYKDSEEELAPKEKYPLDSLNGKKVLLVDDNQDLGQLYKSLFQNKGINMTLAYTPSKAIDIFKELKPDVAILDIGLPEMDGYQLLSELQKLSKATLFFSQSGWGSEKHFQRSKDVGFRRHFVKPVDFNELLSVIAKQIDSAVEN